MTYIEKQDSIEMIFVEQKAKKPAIEEIATMIESLPIEYLIDYIKLLENEHRIQLDNSNGALALNKLGVTDGNLIEEHASEVDANGLSKLEKLLKTEPGKLYTAYTDTILPNELVNDFVLLKARENRERYGNEFNEIFELIQLAVELSRISDLDKHLETFLRLKDNFFNTHTPAVDVGSFYHLSIPLLRQYSVRRGPEEFQKIRS